MEKAYIVTDDINILTSLKSKLSLVGIEAITESTQGKLLGNIIDEIHVIKPKFIILDLVLPEINGFELLNKIKTDEYIPNVPVIIFTHLSDENAKEKSIRFGADFYFLKNEMNIDQFLAKIIKILKNIKIL